MSDEYPKALYREGKDFEWEGCSLDSLLVHDAEEEEIARTDGWGGLDGEKPRRARKGAGE